jgi:hypothetical protein
MVWAYKENARKQNVTDNPGMGTKGNMKEEKSHRQTDGIRRNTTNNGWTERDTTDIDMRRNLILVEGKPLCSRQTIQINK